MNKSKSKFVVTLALVFAVSLLVSFQARNAIAAQETAASTKTSKKSKVTLPQDWNTTNCDECVKDAHAKEVKITVKKAVAGESPQSPLSFDVSKNGHYIQPPAVLGDGHA